MFWKKKDKLKFLNSIRVRLGLGYTAILLASIITVSIYFSFQMRSRLIDVTKQYLVSEIEGAIDLLGEEGNNELGISGFLSRHTRGIKGAHKIGYALFDGKGFIVARSKGFLEDKGSVEDMKARSKGEETSASPVNERPVVSAIKESTILDHNKTTMYLVTRPFLSRTGDMFYLQFGATPFGHQEAVNVLLQTGLFMIPIILFLGLASGVILTRQFLSPILKLIKASNDIVLSDVTQELPIRGTGDELDRLASAFNKVLSKLRQSYQKIIIFTANASHEIRLPITAIKGEAEVILERGGDIGAYREIMRGIVAEMDRLTRMINRLLYLSRGDSGLDKLHTREVDLYGLLDKMVEFYHVLAERKNITLTFKTREGIFKMQADSSKLEELFSNLIENAIRYTPEKGSITLEIIKKRDKYEITVADTGMGIPENEQDKIFERFYRVDEARSRDNGGAGLGLSIAAMIAKAHDGHIRVESYPYKGSVFTVCFPANKTFRH